MQVRKAPSMPDYPFEPRYVDTGDGRIHYIDVGAGPAVVLVHGTPTWSYLYRHLIRVLAASYRVVALDHLGFGRSAKPRNADYRLAAHAARFSRLVDRLGLQDMVLGVHDFGGPIALAHAIERPENVRGLVLFNTWLWSLEGTPAERASRLLGGVLGRVLYTRLNFSPRVLLKASFGDRSKLTKEAHAAYLEPFGSPAERLAPWVLARELTGSGAWYDGLWQRRDRIADKPSLLLWGMKDPAFGPDFLERWKGTLRNARAVELPDAGHFAQEEAPDDVAREVAGFLGGL